MSQKIEGKDDNVGLHIYNHSNVIMSMDACVLLKHNNKEACPWLHYDKTILIYFLYFTFITASSIHLSYISAAKINSIMDDIKMYFSYNAIYMRNLYTIICSWYV